MELNIGMIGYSFMGKAHSNGFRQLPAFFPELGVKPVLKVICGRNPDAVKDAAETYQWEEYETDWEKVIDRDDIDVIDICTPGDQHLPMALAALKAGKHVICEKPLTNTLAEARELLAVAENTNKKTMVAFNYRRVPAVALARQLIAEGRIGEIYHWRAVYLQDWIIDPDFPLVWRLEKDKAGSGPHGDLNAHIIDLALHLVGDIDSVVGADTTFIKERPLLEAVDGGLGAQGGEQMGQVTVDDATMFLARFQNGALGTFEATRFAAGRRNYNHFEINGSKGSIAFNLQKMNELQFYSRDDEDHIQGFREIIVGEGSQPFMGAWWPPGHIIGWEHTFTHEFRDFFEAIAQDGTFSPDFTEGTKVQAVLEAVVDSAASKTWQDVPKI